jgi:hypothetical protein
VACRIHAREYVRIPLSLGDWIEVKKRLTAGEARAIMTHMITRDPPNGHAGPTALGTPTPGGPTAPPLHRVDPMKVGVAKIVVYLTDWSFTDQHDQPLDIKDKDPEYVIGALDAIDFDAFTEVLAAVEAHEAEMDAARAEEKKLWAGANASSLTSPSPVLTTSATSGSLT